MTGVSLSLPSVELACATLYSGRLPVALPRLQKRAVATGALAFDWDRLYYAMALTGIMRQRLPYAELALEAWAHRMRYARHFPHPSLVLRAGASGYYKDAERSAFTSRLGEAVGALAAIDLLDHPTVAHFDLVKSLLGLKPARGPVRRPDYLLARRGRLSLAEMKGRLRHPRAPSLRGVLREAVEQCEAAKRAAMAPVASVFGIVTVLAEHGSGHDSYVCYADPETPAEPEESLRAWRDAAVRANLGARLALAGFEPLADVVWRRPRVGEASPRMARAIDSEEDGTRFLRGAHDPHEWGLLPRIMLDEDVVHRTLALVETRDAHAFADFELPPRRGRGGHDLAVVADGTAIAPAARLIEAENVRL